MTTNSPAHHMSNMLYLLVKLDVIHYDESKHLRRILPRYILAAQIRWVDKYEGEMLG